MCVFLELYVSLETERESQRTVYSSNSNFSRNCLSHISLCFPNVLLLEVVLVVVHMHSEDLPPTRNEQNAR